MPNATLPNFLGFPPAPLSVVLDPKSWYPSPDRAVLRQAWLFPTTLCSFIVLSLPLRKARLWISTPVLLFILSHLRTYTTGQASSDFGRTSFVFGFVLKWIDFAMLAKDGEVFKVEKRRAVKGEKGEWVEEKVEENGLWQRFVNNVDLWIFSFRGINWNWRVKGIPDRAPQSTSYFLFRTLLRLVGTFVLFDVCDFAFAQFPYIRLESRPSFFSQPLSVQVALTWLQKLEVFAKINIPYQLLAFGGVATGFQTEEDWPPAFGSLADSYLVSRFWGRTWHQLLRRPLGMLTPYVQRWLGVKSRGLKRTTLLFCSFFMSGLVHWSGAINLPWAPTSFGLFVYFMMQAVVIRAEDYVIDFGKERGVKGHWLLRCFGYLWTLAWITFSMRYAAAFTYEVGPLSKYRPLGFSLVRLSLPKLVRIYKWGRRVWGT